VKVVWTEPAAQALESIQDFIARDNPGAAWEVAQLIRHAVARLEMHSFSGRKGRVHETYELVLAGSPYVLPYRILEGEIQTLNIYHSARKWPEQFP
jgi:addiction module RelE/StbE family toxin